MMNLTLFSTCKPFSKGSAGLIQRRAIKSWRMMEPRPKIIIFGDEEGVPEICKELDLVNVPEVPRSPRSHCPMLNRMFEMAQDHSPNHVLLFLNADIILTSPYETIMRVQQNFEEFLIVGHRSDVRFADITKEGWIERLLKRRTLGPPDAIDYFIFTPNLWGSLPAFVVGHVGFDNWLIWGALNQGKPVIDATAIIHAFHQTHKPREPNRPDDLENLKMFNWGWANKGRISDATWTLKPQELVEGEKNEPASPSATEAVEEELQSPAFFHGAYINTRTTQGPPPEPEPPAISYSVHEDRPSATSARIQRILDRIADGSGS